MSDDSLYMHGRYGSLDSLDKASKNNSLSDTDRRRAAEARDKILEEQKDSKLNKLRDSLIMAAKLGNNDAAQNIEKEIRAYKGEPLDT